MQPNQSLPFILRSKAQIDRRTAPSAGKKRLAQAGSSILIGGMRYSSKAAFIEDIEDSWAALMTALEGLSGEDLQVAGVCARWSIKDMMAHLTEWHQLAMGWYKEGLKGNKPAMPMAGYKWNQIRELNREFYLRNKDRELKDVRAGLKRSHGAILKLIKSLSEEQLLSPGQFAWTTKYPLTTYFHANTSGHYRWALKHIKTARRQSLFSRSR